MTPAPPPTMIPTRPNAVEWIEGANDGASGVAVLLELARVLEADKLKNEVWLAFFDAEDRGRLDGWPFSVGARHLAENLTVTPQGVVVVDMIGDADQNIFLEQNSTPAPPRGSLGRGRRIGLRGLYYSPTQTYHH